ncbi:MAG: glycosyltransferase, partial [Sphingomonadales bacterium]|nr:glycosyltransferase [Sphingomonadales bacterium]
MSYFPTFLSVVYIVRNQEKKLETFVRHASDKLSLLVKDYELIVVDNGSSDKSVNVLKKLTGESGYPNLQVYALIKEVDADTASWVGVANALGDFVAVIDPLLDDISVLPDMLDKATA